MRGHRRTDGNSEQNVTAGRVQGAVARVRCRVRRLRRVCGQELRLVQLCSSHERSGQKLLAVQLPRGGCLRFCMAVAVPDSALSRDAEQSVELIHTGATGRSGVRGLPWPVSSAMGSASTACSWPQLQCARRCVAAGRQRAPGARVAAPACPARSQSRGARRNHRAAK